MLEDIHSILVNLLSNIIWLPIGALLVAIGYFIQVQLPKRRLWQLTDPSNLVVCAATSTMTYTGEYHRPATGIGQVRALALAAQSLSKAYSHQLDMKNILLSVEPLQERIENDLLLLGGPKNNAVTAHFLDLMQDRQPVLQFANPDRIIWREKVVQGRWVNAEAVEYNSQVAHKKVVLDYGLVMRVQSPFTSRNRAVILFSGSHTYGLVAAAKFFTMDMKGFRWMRRLRDKNIVAVVSTRVLDGHPTKIKLERLYTW
jgi:hypothetical protein